MIIYYFIINVVSFCLYGIDKYKAKHHKWRISEAMLLMVSFLGGGVGAFLSMHLFHHKTKHIRFVVCVPLSILLHLGILIFLSRNL